MPDTPTKFKDVVKTLYNNGYKELLPIVPGDKAVKIRNWVGMDLSIDVYRRWMSGEMGDYGVGFRLGQGHIAVDIDVYDAEVAEAIAAYADFDLGNGLIRVGSEPKVGLVFRCAEKFGKIVYKIVGPLYKGTRARDRNAQRQEHKVEILGAGSQMVMFGMHPDVGKPYHYLHGQSPLDVKSAELTEVTEAEIRAWLEGLNGAGVLPEGWRAEPVGAGKSGGGSGFVEGEDEDETYLLNYKKPKAIPVTDVRAALSLLDPDMDREGWLEVGMSLHHWSGGSDAGFEIWDGWSEGSGKYKEGDCAVRWSSFDAVGKSGRNMITIGTLLKKSKDVREKQRLESEKSWLKRVGECADELELREQIPAGVREDTSLDAVGRENIAVKWRKALKEKFQVTVSAKAAKREMVLSKAEKAERGGMPKWCAGYVYVQHEEVFFHVKKKLALSITSFNLTHGSELEELKNGEEVDGRINPSTYAANVLGIDKVNRLMYMPGRGDVFEIGGMKCANRYDPRGLPKMPAELSGDGLAAVECVENHLKMILPDDMERGVFTSWLAHNVQKIGVKIRWSPLLRGTEGDGKSFFGDLLRAVLGGRNVNTLQSHTLSSSFSDWAHGHAVCVIEEIYTPGHNRHEVINKMKMYISNDDIEIHPKGFKPYGVKNTQNYILFTNHLDALPVGEESRRYFILRTVFADAPGSLKRLMERDPEYYDRLFDAIKDHPGSIRRWLMDYKLAAEFKSQGHAPETAEKQAMIDISRPEEVIIIEDLIDDPDLEDINYEFIITDSLVSEMRQRGYIKRGRTVSKILKGMGYSLLHEIRKFNVPDNKVRCKNRQLRAWANEENLPDNLTDIKEYIRQKVDSDYAKITTVRFTKTGRKVEPIG